MPRITVTQPSFRVDMFGYLTIDKPAGLTSRDVVNRVQRLVRPIKVGHAGTLDPLATGVLVVCLGSATRLVEYVQRLEKRYDATFLLGRSSDTEDVEGHVVEQIDAPLVTRTNVESVLPLFLGSQSQVPPAYSALKVAGRRAYALARAGESVELAPRPITIHSLHLVEFNYPTIRIEVVCSSGTYIRSLGRDIARALGTEAVMSALRRTAIGPFTLEQAIVFDELTRERIEQHLMAPGRALDSLPRVTLDRELETRVRHGQTIPLPAGHSSAEVAAFDEEGRLIGILTPREPGYWRPHLVFSPS